MKIVAHVTLDLTYWSGLGREHRPFASLPVVHGTRNQAADKRASHPHRAVMTELMSIFEFRLQRGERGGLDRRMGRSSTGGMDTFLRRSSLRRNQPSNGIGYHATVNSVRTARETMTDGRGEVQARGHWGTGRSRNHGPGHLPHELLPGPSCLPPGPRSPAPSLRPSKAESLYRAEAAEGKRTK